MVDNLRGDTASGAYARYCTVCARPMGIFPDDQPDWPTGPLCGECYQSNQMEDEVLFDTLYGDSAEHEGDDDL